MKKLSLLLHDKGITFGLKIIFVYLCWKVFAFFTHGTMWWLAFTDYVGHQYAILVAGMLVAMGDKADVVGININFTNGFIAVCDLCLAFPAMFVYTGSIIIFPGAWQNKIWYIPLGWLIIVIINILRMLLVCYAWIHWSSFYFNLHHTVIGLGIFYGITLALIVLWTRRFSGLYPPVQ
jgi:exosortase/archaeosortase family protein